MYVAGMWKSADVTSWNNSACQDGAFGVRKLQNILGRRKLGIWHQASGRFLDNLYYLVHVLNRNLIREICYHEVSVFDG